jgi:hypothetical protein
MAIRALLGLLLLLAALAWAFEGPVRRAGRWLRDRWLWVRWFSL